MFFTCKYCNSRFVKEANLEKHFCENRKKHILLSSKIGRSAFFYYGKWRNLMGFSSVDEISFINSKYFKPFVNFMFFCEEKLIPDKTGYIRYMLQKKVIPSFWCLPEYYESYMLDFDKIYSPLKQVEMSLEYLSTLSRKLDCKFNEILDKLQPVEIIKLIGCKKLSPWLLLFMKSFRDKVTYFFDKEQKILINAVIDISEWKARIDNNPEVVKNIKNILQIFESASDKYK